MKNHEKIPFLKAVLFIAKADADVDLSELTFFQDLSRYLGLSDMELSNTQTIIMSGKESLEESLSEITEYKTKLRLIYEMTTLSFADGVYDPAEKEVVHKSAEFLHVPEEKVKEIEKVVLEAAELRKKTEQILEG